MRELQKNRLAFLLLLVVSCAFFWETLLFRKAFFYFDIITFNLPLRQFLGDSLRQGIFPLWSAGKYGGFPVFAEGQGGFLYPPNLLLFPFMEAWKAFNLSMALNFLLGSWFMYIFLRRKISTFPALLGGCAFAYSGYFLCHSIHTAQINTAIWLPLLFLFMEKFLEGGGMRSAASGALVLGIMTLAGHANACMISLAGLAFYLLFYVLFLKGRKGIGPCLLVMFLIVGLGLGLGAVQLLPMAELTEHSQRFEKMPYSFLTQGSYSPIFFATLLLPNLFGNRGTDTIWMDESIPFHEMDVYMGAVSLLLLIAALAHRRDRSSLVWFSMWAVSIIFMVGRHTPFYHAFSYLPYFDRMRLPSKFGLLFCFSSSVLAAFGAETILQGERARPAAMSAWALLAATPTAAVAWATYGGLLGNSGAAGIAALTIENQERLRGLITSDIIRASLFLLLSLGLAAALTARYRAGGRNILAGGLLALTLADLFLFSRSRFALIDPSIYTMPPAPVQLIKKDEGFYRIYNADPLSAAPFAAPGWEKSKLPYFHSLNSLPFDTPMLYGIPSIKGGSPLALRRTKQIAHLPRFVDLLNGRYLLSQRELPQKGLRLLSDNGSYVYLNQNALDRVYAVPAALFAKSDREALDLATSPGFNPKKNVILEGAEPRQFLLDKEENPNAPFHAKIAAYSDNEAVVEADMPSPGFLVLSDTYYPGWRAEDNGTATRIFRANYVVRAVYLAKGKHRVRFFYSPDSFRFGLIISTLSFIAVLVLYLKPERKP